MKTKIIKILFLLIATQGYTQSKINFKVKSSETSILYGDSITITWKAKDVDSVVMYKPTYKVLANEGTITIKPDTNIQYQFIAYKLKKTLFKEIALKKKRWVNINVRIPSFNKIEIPKVVNDEEVITVNWNARNTKNVKLSIFEDTLFMARDQISFKLDTTTIVKFTAINKIGTEVIEERKVEITYVDYPPENQRIDSGDVVIVKWHYKKCNSVFFDTISTPFNGLDTILFYPTKSNVYNITAIRTNNDTIRDSITVNVTNPKIDFFTVPESIIEGQSVALKWSVSNANEIEIEGLRKDLEANGKIMVSPLIDTKYKLIVRSPFKTDSIIKKVVVLLRRKVFAKNIIDASKIAKRKVEFVIYNSDISKYPDEIKLYVLALDSLGNYIRNLAPPYGTEEISKKYFENIVEYSASGKKLDVESFNITEVQNDTLKSRDISLVMDYSGSMGRDIKKLENNCKRLIASKLNNDYISVVKFDHQLSLEIPLTKDKKEIAKKVKFCGLKGFGGYTALYAGIDEGLISLENNSGNEKLLFLFTDGFENSSIFYFGKRAIFAQQVARKARKNKVKINVVGIGFGVDTKLLKFMALLTGGEYYKASRSKKINDIIRELNIISKNYYVITYKPTQKDGETSIALEYDNNQGKTITTKKSFFIGENYDVTKYENNNLTFFGVSSYSWGKKKIIIAPQAAAHYSLNEYSIKKKSIKKLDFFVKFLTENPKTTAIIVGHTDLRGNDEDCLELSEKRAESVYNYLISKGISAKRLKTIGEGKTKPIWNPEDKAIKAKENRRVEMIIFK